MLRWKTLLCALAAGTLLIGGGLSAQDVAAVGPGAVLAAETTAPSPVTTVETLHAGLLDVMQRADELGFAGRYDVLDPLVAGTFDLEFMSSKSVGRYWKRLTPEEQRDWRQKFRGFLTANYAGNFDRYDGERFETLGEEEAPRDTRVVLTKIHVPGDADVVLNYRLHAVEGEWRIIDVYLKGTVSELALRRSDFSAILKEKGFGELTAAVDKKIADLRAKDS